MLQAIDVSRYFLCKQHRGEADIDIMKLQKLLYYAQGYSLVLNDRPIFKEEIEAWTHGPVVPEVYHFFKGKGSRPLTIPHDFNIAKIPLEDRRVLDDVYREKGQYSAWRLRTFTHREIPWLSTWKDGLGKNLIIEIDKLYEFFREELALNGEHELFAGTCAEEQEKLISTTVPRSRLRLVA